MRAKTILCGIFIVVMLWIAVAGVTWALKQSKICEQQYQDNINNMLEGLK